MKFCKDCKHSTGGENGLEFIKCKLSVRNIELDTGITNYNYCSWNRFDYNWWSYLSGACGRKGRFFEPK
jgi:hypothetical protein